MTNKKTAKQIRREKNREYLKKHNLNNGKYTINGKEYTPSQLADLSPKKLQKLRKRENDKRREERNYQRMIDSGLSKTYASKNKRKNKNIVEEIVFKGDRTVYHSKEYLSVMWADVTGDSNFSAFLDRYKDVSTNDMVAQINNTMSSTFKGGSSDFRGVAKIIIHENKNITHHRAEKAISRGYKDKMISEKNRVICSNQWTVRGYASMMLAILESTSDDLKNRYYDEFKNFAYENLPEIYNQIF